MSDEVTVGTRGRTCAPTVTGVRGERGAVSAEAAVVLPLVIAVAMVAGWLVALASAQVRVVDAAREAARAAARGDADEAAVAAGRRVAPDGAVFQVSRAGGSVTVRVVAEVRGPGGLLAFLPGVPVSSAAVAAEEPS